MHTPVKIPVHPRKIILRTPADLFAAVAPFLTTIGIAATVLLILLLFGERMNKLFFNAPLKDFDSVISSNGVHHLQIPSGEYWQIEYEQNHEINYTGSVSHISMDHEAIFPIISHDLLITSGDYANPERVAASVSNHHFSWNNLTESPLMGSIHLLHIVPINQQIFEKLINLRRLDEVSLTGWEIQQIDAYSSDHSYLGYWTDDGCNTILITAVELKE